MSLLFDHRAHCFSPAISRQRISPGDHLLLDQAYFLSIMSACAS